MALAERALALATELGTDFKTLAARPVSGVKLMQQFTYTNPSVARPAVPSYVVLNWVGPAGSGGAAPNNMAAGDTWDMEAS